MVTKFLLKKSVWDRSYSEDINLGSLKVSFLVLQDCT